MKKRMLALVFTALLVVGCGSSSNTSSVEGPVEPPPTNTAPVEGGSGAYKSDISGAGGFVDIEYIIKNNPDIDFNSFIIVHAIDGQNYEHYFPSAFTNGSLTRVEEKVYIPSNDTGGPVTHTITVEYYDDDIRVVNTYTITQEFEPEAAEGSCSFSTEL